MIPAHEALKLPTAQLSEEQMHRADALEADIDRTVRSSMERRGCDIETKETDANVVAEVNQRLKTAGYSTEWRPNVEQNRLNPTMMKHIGWKLTLAPTDVAYKLAGGAILA